MSKTPLSDAAAEKDQDRHYDMTVHIDDCREIEMKMNKLRHALEKIRDEDYRGNRHSSHFVAKKALEEIE
jgi:hypothetical protein